MEKILVVGICGAGKSTLALSLSKKLNLPVVHLDQHYWKSGWEETPKAKWEEILHELLNEPKWIIEGNYSSSFDIRIQKADTILVLDYHPLLAIFRATKRILKHYGKARPDMTVGCPERFNWEFYKFIWKFNKNHRPRLDTSLERLGKGKKVIRFSNPRTLRQFLKSIKS